MEIILSELEAKNEELAAYTDDVSQLPAASSEESVSLVTEITVVYFVCVSVQTEYVVIFSEVSEVFRSEETSTTGTSEESTTSSAITTPVISCYERFLRVEAAVNSSLTEAISIMSGIISNPENASISDLVIQNATRSVEDFESTFRIFFHFLSMTSTNSSGGCPLEELEQKAQDLEAKTEGLKVDAAILLHFSPDSVLYPNLVLTIENIYLGLEEDLPKLWEGMEELEQTITVVQMSVQ
ncbi:uncharacterized protein LOC125029185 [Penaeus chinensis]|uniref:uncharacterized protein LOC125029185 n=1 Tax=Penaeus chinensis TaxID=139456 RepID=UPI001FB68635|nr:uncharacterized protein LOC125029185 [Penaeus chinensis]